MTDSIDVPMNYEGPVAEEAAQQKQDGGSVSRRFTEADQELGQHTQLGIDIGDGHMALEIGNIDNRAPEPTIDPSTVEPFASEEEMAAAQDRRTEDGRYYLTQVNPEYRARVRARTIASMGEIETFRTGFDPKAAERREAQKEARRQAQAVRGKESLKINAGSEQTPQVPAFESEAELDAAVGDPRYDRSPSYRRKVDARLAVTDFGNLTP